MGRPKYVYRGKRRYRWVITAALCLVIILIALAIWLFTYMQKFIVYDKDGLSVVLPFQRTEEAENTPEDEPVYVPSVDAEIVVEEPDYSDVLLAADELDPLSARYISAESMSSSNISYTGFQLTNSVDSALVLQLKTEGGYLSYHSSVALTDSYGVNGQENIRDVLSSLKEQGVYLVAEISCLQDTAMATRNAPVALKNSAGEVISSAGGSWLDPYSKTARSYVGDLIAEAADMGFDEVLLSGMTHPQTGDVQFSQEMTGAPTIMGSVTTFAIRMSEQARELGMGCSVLCDASALRRGASADVGQDLELFTRVFDRLYVKTDMNYFTADISALEDVLGGSVTGRIVPVVSGYTPVYDSWAWQ